MTTQPFDLGSLLREVDIEGTLAPCALHRLLLGPGAVDEVARTVEELLPARSGGSPRARVTLLVDRTPISRRGEDLKGLVERQLGERFVVERTVLDDGHAELHVVDAVLEAATAASRGADAVVALGGGTISDIGKVAARREDGPDPVLVSVQTAASVDGFTDDVSVVLRDGVKRTVPSRWPDAVVADAETIAEAPAAMNRAGFGEMTSMLVAPADWRLAGLLGVDPGFHAGPTRLLDVVGSDIAEWSPGVRTADPEAVARLTMALGLRGVATGVAGTTAVLSGVEHLISHMLDQHHGANRFPMGLHGAQVGVGAVVAAAAWEMLFERLAADGRPRLDEDALDPARARARVEQAFVALDATGKVAAECWQDYAAKLETVTALRSRILDVLAAWPQHEPDLRRLTRPSAEIAAGLEAAGAPATFAELDPGVPDDLARWAVTNCALMRRRFTVVDLLTVLGWWTADDVDEVRRRAEDAVSAARSAHAGDPVGG